MKFIEALAAFAAITVNAAADETHIRGTVHSQLGDATSGDGDDFKGPEYIALSRQEKSDMIWAKVTENENSGEWHTYQLLFEDMDKTFDTEGDEFDCSFLLGCRNKAIHAVGNVGKVSWVDQGGHPYTGIFKGGDTGYVRMSSAMPVDPAVVVMMPGMGVKFLRDGADSANFVAMFRVDGQDSFNFFEHDWSNHVPPSEDTFNMQLVVAKFKTATEFVQTVGLSEMASADQTGAVEATPIFPFKLRFQPTGEFTFPSQTYEVPFEQYLQTIPADSVLFDIYALDRPTELGGTETKIGQLKLESTMVTSYWGDEHMFFRHQRMEDDLALRPEWEPHTPNPQFCLANGGYVPTADDCPFLKAKYAIE